MKKNGFALVLIILMLAILGTSGYFVYKNYFAKTQILITSNQDSNLSVTGKITGRKIDINVRGEGLNRGKESTGTMTILPGWEVEIGDDKANPSVDGVVLKYIYIRNGDYKITISSTGGMQSICNYQSQTDGKLKLNEAVLFEDQSGYQYLREKPTSYSSQSLTICSNGFEGSVRQGFSDSNATFGDVFYNIPQNPDNKILNQMDNMIASFKNN